MIPTSIRFCLCDSFSVLFFFLLLFSFVTVEIHGFSKVECHLMKIRSQYLVPPTGVPF